MTKKAKKAEISLDDLIKKMDELELRIDDCEIALDEYLQERDEDNGE